jgi:hypothetical protein
MSHAKKSWAGQNQQRQLLARDSIKQDRLRDTGPDGSCAVT